MILGYARVSTDGQSLDAQVKQLRAAKAEKVLREAASGAKTDRVQLRRALAQLSKGDVLLVTRLDRLARSTRDLLNTLAAIRRQRGWLPLAWRYLGRYQDSAWPVDAHGPERRGRVRGRTDPRPYRRGSRPRRRDRRQAGPEAYPRPSPAARGH